MIYDELASICRDHTQLFEWCIKNNLLGECKGRPCPRDGCEGHICLRDHTSKCDKYHYKCSKKYCSYRRGIRNDSFFANAKLSIEQILKLTYYWVYKLPGQYIERELGFGSPHTAVTWKKACREVCSTILEQDSEVIGGPDKIVEIDESKFGKTNGVWVFGGIERGSNRMFMVTVADRSKETLIPIIQKYVLPGTTIFTDCWKSYDSLESLGYTHGTVDHSKGEFVSPDGVSTNRIVSTWRAMKASLPHYGTSKQLYDSYFCEYVVRKKYLEEADDKFETFLGLVKKVFNPNLNLPPASTASATTSTTSKAPRKRVADEDCSTSNPSCPPPKQPKTVSSVSCPQASTSGPPCPPPKRPVTDSSVSCTQISTSGPLPPPKQAKTASSVSCTQASTSGPRPPPIQPITVSSVSCTQASTSGLPRPPTIQPITVSSVSCTQASTYSPRPPPKQAKTVNNVINPQVSTSGPPRPLPKWPITASSPQALPSAPPAPLFLVVPHPASNGESSSVLNGMQAVCFSTFTNSEGSSVLKVKKEEDINFGLY